MNPNRQPLKETEQKIWEYILGYFADHASSPTRNEIADHLGYPRKSGPQTVQWFLSSMQAKGYIVLKPRKWRNISIVTN